MADVSLLRQLEHNLRCELSGMQQDISQLWLHQAVWIFSSIVIGVNASPRRTYDQGIRLERLDIQEVFVDVLESIKAFVVDLHVMLKHLEFVWIDIVYNVFFEVIA